MRIGILIPEFPGQTHVFFFREMHRLSALGIEVCRVSTRRPAKSLVVHAGSAEIMRRTSYLFPPPLGGLAGAARELLCAGPTRLMRYVHLVMRAADVGVKAKLRLLALALPGAQLSHLARRQGWQHVHVHSCADSAAIAMAASIIGNISYSLTLHGLLSDYGPAQREKWACARFAVVITRRLINDVRVKLDGALPPRVVVAPMGVNVEVWRRERPYEPWCGKGPFRIVSCGRLCPAKGHHVLIEAVKHLRDRGVNANLSIIGEDNAGGECRRFLEGRISELSLQHCVRLLGAQPEEQVRQVEAASHVFALSSLEEALGVAIMEAMAMEMPVVVTAVGGVAELVDAAVDGLLVQPNDSRQLAAALERVAGDMQLARRLGMSAREKVCESFHDGISAKVLATCLGAVADLPTSNLLAEQSVTEES